jgi:hypothetical protein
VENCPKILDTSIHLTKNDGLVQGECATHEDCCRCGLHECFDGGLRSALTLADQIQREAAVGQKKGKGEREGVRVVYFFDYFHRHNYFTHTHTHFLPNTRPLSIALTLYVCVCVLMAGKRRRVRKNE